MKPEFLQRADDFIIENYNQARPFASFLPGISGEYGKPMWVFYTNRGQCVASFGVRNKDGAMLEFYPANKAYELTPLLGFRTFLRITTGKGLFYEPFRMAPDPAIRQILHIRPHEIELEEIHRKLKLQISVSFFNAPNESLPVLVRDLRIQNKGTKPVRLDVLDGLPQVVPFGLSESFLKMMSRTMEAFAEVQHVGENLPFFKLKVEPSDKPDVKQITGGFFAFALKEGRTQSMLVDPKNIFGDDTSFQTPQAFQTQKKLVTDTQQTEAITASAFSLSQWSLRPGQQAGLQSYYGQAGSWEIASAFRKRLEEDKAYPRKKREENAALIHSVTDAFALHSGAEGLDAYSRQTFLDNTLRGGRPFILEPGDAGQVFHYYSRKHGDMERDYNFFELAPTYYSQGNGNFRDVNQNRRSEVLLYPGLNGKNIETFFNLLQLDGFNPLVIQYERFYVEKERLGEFDPALAEFLAVPFNPGALLERLMNGKTDRDSIQDEFLRILRSARKIQDAQHGEGFWIDHWTYNLDLLENFHAVYPEKLRALLIEQRSFTYYDNDHVVQPRHKKYVRREEGSFRQLKAVVLDAEKRDLIRQRALDPHKVRTKHGTGAVYQTSLLVKLLNLIAVKAASLDPFGVGLEMEADKPGWCDSLNGLPALFGSSVCEAFALHRAVDFLAQQLPEIMAPDEKHAVPEEVADFYKSVGEALALARPDDFHKTWDTLAALKESFREKTRLGLSGEEVPVSLDEILLILKTISLSLLRGLQKAFQGDGLCVTYFINQVVRAENLPMAASADPLAEPVQHIKALEFKQIPVTPFLEGPVHALRAETLRERARKIYAAVRSSELYDKKLKMFKLNAPLTNESFEIGRMKIFPAGWLENESIFLHMAYKFMLETLRAGLAREFFEDFKNGLIAFQDPGVYGRSTFENSSFLVSSRFADARMHGVGCVARLTGAAAEWISMVHFMGLGRQPFKWLNEQLRFEPQPYLAEWLFERKPVGEFGADTFGFKVFGGTWIIYHNPARRDTFGPKPLSVSRFRLTYRDGKETTHEGTFLPDTPSRDLRDGKLSRVQIDLA